LTARSAGEAANPMIDLDGRAADAVDDLHPGIVRLTVPLMEDVIQVGTADRQTTGTVELTKTPSAMVVRRTDGRALQAEILHERENGPPLRMRVFTEPVPSLRLRCVPGPAGSRCWTVCPGGPIRSQPDLNQLVTTIAAFGLAKQRRGHRPPGSAASA
jgi:hypothetical protein